MELAEELCGEISGLRALLSERILAQLRAAPSEPFQGDQDYFENVLSRMRMLQSSYETQMGMQARAEEPSKAPGHEFERSHKLVAGLDKLAVALDELREARLAVTASKPRIVRLCAKWNLPAGEARLVEAIVAKDVGTSWPGGSFGVSSDIMSLSRFTSLSFHDLFKFVSSAHPLVKANLLEYFESDRPLSSSLTFIPPAQAALLGKAMGDHDMLKIDGTALAEVLQEETGQRDPNKQAQQDEAEKVDEKSEKSEEEEAGGLKLPADEPDDIASLLKTLRTSTDVLPPVVDQESDDEDDSKLVPYRSDLDYLETQIDYLFATLQVADLRQQEESNEAAGGAWGRRGNAETEQRMRQMQAKARANRAKAVKRLELTRAAGKWLPRVERMAAVRQLDDFEKDVLLVLIGCHISPKFHALDYRQSMRVENLLRAFCENFEEQVKNRKYFYKSSKLVTDGFVRMSGASFDNDLNSYSCAVDRRMLDFAMGLDTEFSELVDGSHLYWSKVDLGQVVLSDEQKKLIMDTVSNYDEYKRARRRYGFDDKVSYGSGIVMLFYGVSGTGKTMLANGIANHLNKRILLINYPSLGQAADENLKWIFREAKINDAILFFDECEAIFESRDRGNTAVTLLLTEFERHDGLVILATNRAYDLDEAMHRRITLALEFNKPDPILRERIWAANIPKALRLAADVDLKYLALQFELTGGFIKNALLSALAMAVSRDGEENAVVRQEDLVAGAKLQLRGRLRMIDFTRRRVPSRSIEDLILAPEQKRILNEIVSFEKARQVLYSQWGFNQQDKGTTVLLYGPPGTGKTMASEAIAFAMGKPLKIVNSAELVSKWVGDTPKNIDAVFEEGKNVDAVLVFDEAEGLFGQRSSSSESATDRYANVDVGLLLYHMERYPGVVVLCTNQIGAIDNAFFRRIKFVVEFPRPEAPERARLWASLIPKEAPQDKDIDYKKLGQIYELSGGHIASAVFRAAARAALHSDSTLRKVTYGLLEEAGREEEEKTKSVGPHVKGGMYS